MEVRFTSERVALPRNLGDVFPILHHQPLAVEWEH